ncbi:ATP12-domain-containing protein [Trichocladium antarcticum]|uniref:ATP12-domain-containing protein n=1 Tax=Trichocladium antarcticum TaxID=1450529 RepID=A0AAN6UQN9_9PEZI|nr:ATP12-domain-containing protein [Trichocladium antarcticum]
MAPATRLCLLSLRPAAAATARNLSRGAARPLRALHTNPAQPAKVVPVYGTGPPPEPPLPPVDEYAAEERAARLARRKKHAEVLRLAEDIKDAAKQHHESTDKKNSGLKRRFWKDVIVREVDGALEIHLDSRPLRHPTTKAVMRIPLSKPHLAHGIALEWDSLLSAYQATKQHLIPLTSLTCRAIDLAADDAASASASASTPAESLRTAIATVLLRYLDTDSLLCFAPLPDDPLDPALRPLQEQVYQQVASHLTARVWPGVSIVPVLDGASLFPAPQPQGTREVVQGWILGLSAFELAGLERAALAGKSLLAAARLLAEWSEDGAGVKETRAGDAQQEGERFGVDEAARAVSLEVDWQTKKWGEVEDTHDVEREDLKRQLGSVVLLVSGTGSKR